MKKLHENKPNELLITTTKGRINVQTKQDLEDLCEERRINRDLLLVFLGFLIGFLIGYAL